MVSAKPLREGHNRPLRFTTLGLALASYLLGCAPSEGKRVIAFIQATKDSAVNQAIMTQYALPLFHTLEESGEPFQLDLYPITGHSAASTAFYSGTVRPGPMKGKERKAARKEFLRLHQQLDETYGGEESQLVDILGTIRLVDDVLGKLTERRGRWFGATREGLHVIYVSDMVQSNGVAGYDFTGFYGGKTLEECRENLRDEVGAQLRNREEFSSVRVLVLPLDLQSLFRQHGIEATPPPPNLQSIQTFWAQDVFGSLLNVKSYEVDTSEDMRELQDFLGD